MTKSGDEASCININMHSMFYGEIFEYWNDRLISFYISDDPKLWDTVEDSYDTPKDVTGVEIFRKYFKAEQNKQYNMHYKTITFMINSITFIEFDKCNNKETTKSIFDVLVINYEGSKQV